MVDGPTAPSPDQCCGVSGGEAVIDEERLLGSWTHAHEEDDEGVQAFRPASAELPPSRGRTRYTFLPGHRATTGAPGPDDRGTVNDGTWTLESRAEGDVLQVALPDARATYLVVAAAPDLLRLQPVPPS